VKGFDFVSFLHHQSSFIDGNSRFIVLFCSTGRRKKLGALGANSKNTPNPLSTLRNSAPKTTGGKLFFSGGTGGKLPVFACFIGTFPLFQGFSVNFVEFDG
jgi:hypothetical protein